MFSKIFNKLKVWWYNRGKTFEPPKEPVNSTPLPPKVPPPVDPDKVMLWYPKAVKGTGMKVQGEYKHKYPAGAVVHFTAGHCETESDAKGALNWGIQQGYAYFVIGPTGVVYQNFPLSHWGHHAGISSHPELGSGLSSKLVGIEVTCAGKVDSNGKAWFGKKYSSDRLRISSNKDNIQAGTYVKYTPAQEQALTELLVWLKLNNPGVFSVDYIVGHDEISPSRKNDPGASLSMTMPNYRAMIKTLVKKEI